MDTLTITQIRALNAVRTKVQPRGAEFRAIKGLKAEGFLTWVGPGDRDWKLTPKGEKAVADATDALYAREMGKA